MQKIKVLVLGQTPPPFLGQAMMIDRLVKGKYDNIEIVHIRMAFSDNLKEIGKFGFAKLFHAVQLIFKTIQMRFSHSPEIFYYSPSGPHLVPLLRDIMILVCIRPFFKKVVFHYNAAGVSQLLERSGHVIRFLGKLVYDRPAGAVQISELNPADGKYFKAKKIFIVKNGLEDAADKFLPIVRTSTLTTRVLFVGAMYEERGLFVMIEAARLLKQAQLPFQIVCVGDFATHEFHEEVLKRCKNLEIEDCFTFTGTLTGDAKWNEFLRADIFVFPSFVESESFGNVIAEAMMFQLPVIATKWNAIPDLVDDGRTGFLIPTKEAAPLANRIKTLADANLRIQMGTAGRQKFLAEFQLSKHLENMEKMFVDVAREN